MQVVSAFLMKNGEVPSAPQRSWPIKARPSDFLSIVATGSNELVASAKASFRSSARLVETNDRAALLEADPQVAQRIENGRVGSARISGKSAAGSSSAEARAGGAATHDKYAGEVQKSMAAVAAG